MNQSATTPPTTKPRTRVDWDAVERDFRTGKFTLRELEAKHGVSYAQISRKSKEQAWEKDLREEIKIATDVSLLREAVTHAQKNVTDVVLVRQLSNQEYLRAQWLALPVTKLDINPVSSGTQPTLALPHARHCTPNALAFTRWRASGYQAKALQPTPPRTHAALPNHSRAF